MERIKQALEKARQERGEAPPPGVSPAGPAMPGAGPARRAAEPLSVTYTQTRAFAPDSKVLLRNRVLAGTDDPSVMAAYKMLRTQVLQRMKEKGWKALAITSPGPGEGKTLTAVNLAVSLAREVNHTVLLVDLDLRNPSVHQYFGYVPESGVSDAALHGVPITDALFNPGIERLVVLPGREAFSHSSEVLSSPGMVALVSELKHRYLSRMVIFDLPPVLSADDAVAFAPYVDAALLVIQEGKTTREDVTRAIGFLRDLPILGTVLNRSVEATTSSYYYY
jgi:capsular exopolysaccharide synthesis family protein